MRSTACSSPSVACPTPVRRSAFVRTPARGRRGRGTRGDRGAPVLGDGRRSTRSGRDTFVAGPHVLSGLRGSGRWVLGGGRRVRTWRL
jgi:hypothetical protein